MNPSVIEDAEEIRRDFGDVEKEKMTMREVTTDEVDTSRATFVAPGVLLSLTPEGVYLDLLKGLDGWNRVFVPVGENYRVGAPNPDYSYEIAFTLRPPERPVRTTRFHRWLHRRHDRLHGRVT